jgi:hypothetical protein
MTGNLPSDASPFQNGKDHPIKTIKDKQKMEMKLLIETSLSKMGPLASKFDYYCVCVKSADVQQTDDLQIERYTL